MIYEQDQTLPEKEEGREFESFPYFSEPGSSLVSPQSTPRSCSVSKKGFLVCIDTPEKSPRRKIHEPIDIPKRKKTLSELF